MMFACQDPIAYFCFECPILYLSALETTGCRHNLGQCVENQIKGESVLPLNRLRLRGRLTNNLVYGGRLNTSRG